MEKKIILLYNEFLQQEIPALKSIFGIFHYSLKWKLILIISAIIFTVIISIGLFSFFESSRAIRQDVERFSRQILKQANLNLSRYYMEYAQFFFHLEESKEVQDWFDADREKYEYAKTYYYVVERIIQPFSFQHPELLTVTLYNNNGNERHYRARKSLSMEYSITKQPELLQAAESGQMYASIQVSSDYYGDGTGETLLPVISLLKRVSFGSTGGYVKTDFSIEPTLEILNSIDLGENSKGLIINSSGQIIAHPDPELILTSMDPGYMNEIHGSDDGSFFSEETYEMVIYTSVPNTDWKTVVIVPYRNVAGSIFRIRDFTLLIAVISLIVAIYFVFIVASSMTNRIHLLSETMKATELGNFEVRVNEQGMDEISDLCVVYNHMLERLQNSLEELTRTKILQQEAVLSALQSQINSHFLYNTLEGINSMAHLADHREIEQTTIALSNMLRYTSQYKDTIVTVQDEVKHLKDYLQIIKLRYLDDVFFHIEVEEECESVPCLKAILQPIAENSIKHGFDLNKYDSYDEHFTIRIRVYRTQDQYVRVDIEDNGTGFNPDTFKELVKKISGNNSDLKYREISRIGLLNVHYRLRIYYKDEKSGLSIQNMTDKDGGARISVIFPAGANRQQPEPQGYIS
ncbi:MAG: sensor histidine kinase [Spirochaetia bacterium]